MENEKITPSNFVATVYGELTPLNNTGYSKARLRIFYLGLNRNGSFITEDAAKKMIASLPGTPIVGYYDIEMEDFLDHMTPRETKAIGFVPDALNFDWETHLDPDGIYRTYACTDVILWTARYPEASKVVGKSHSMELNPDTVSGSWEVEDGEYCFKISSAEFFGLCVLGDHVEPCFEGSSFYSLQQKLVNSTIISEFTKMKKQYYNSIEAPTAEKENGGQAMDEEKKKELVNEENSIQENSENNAEVNENAENPEENKIEENQENSENVNEEIEEQPQDENKEENNENENEEEHKEEVHEEPQENVEENQVEEDKKEENHEEEIQDYSKVIAEKDALIEELKAENAELQNYKMAKMREEKISILDNFKAKLSENEYNSLFEKIDSFADNMELKKEIGLIFLNKMDEEEEKNSNEFSLIKEDEKIDGVAALIASHVK